MAMARGRGNEAWLGLSLFPGGFDGSVFTEHFVSPCETPLPVLEVDPKASCMLTK